ncbi:MAG: KOW motif domain-containing protein [Candidatus Organicella extenuata]|jgi:ribosomal protein L24|uniref:KOW motif domain-containing protein n=1 Tax=Candidatus Organicella extenuata TaxID=2841811 RepID=A0AA51BKQ6_9BACT|nr:MAG: KOW motif domain-containing protein [Candidatus Organicella extenuata]
MVNPKLNGKVVKVIAGNFKNKVGVVFNTKYKGTSLKGVFVKGLNLKSNFIKKSFNRPLGSIDQSEQFIHISNVKFIYNKNENL